MQGLCDQLTIGGEGNLFSIDYKQGSVCKASVSYYHIYVYISLYIYIDIYISSVAVYKASVLN